MNLKGDRLARGDDIDLDRVVIDPDYRRRVLADLRRDRLADQGATPAPAALRPGAASSN